MNTFAVGDRVFAKEKNRRNGNVVHVMCDTCEKCKSKSYASCTGEVKNKLLVSFFDTTAGKQKRFKYEHTELEAEPPLPMKEPEKVYDLSPKDIRPLGDATVDVPLIVPEEDEEDEEQAEDIEIDIDVDVDVEVEELREEVAKETKQQARKASMKAASGMFFDQFLTLDSSMGRPI